MTILSGGVGALLVTGGQSRTGWAAVVIGAAAMALSLLAYRASSPRVRVLGDPQVLDRTYDNQWNLTFGIVQVWFLNQPRKPTESSDVKRVSATLEFFDFFAPYSEAPRLSAYGRWASTLAPGHIGFRDEAHTEVADIPAGSLPAKLVVLLKHMEDASAYVFAKENLHAHPDGRHPAFELPSGRYNLRVKLFGQNIDQSFYFAIDNPGVGAMPLVAVRRSRR